jgi:N-acetyl-anhydromuramyl-L-alanine amidase AmpD
MVVSISKRDNTKSNQADKRGETIMKIVDGWLDQAIEIDYTNKSESREGNNLTHIVLHGTAGGTSAQNIGNYFATSDVQASAHFVIGTDGAIVQGVPLGLAAWANGPISGTPTNLGFRTAGDGIHRDSWWNSSVNPNWVTCSIEHCKPDDANASSLTPAQEAASFALVKCICETYGVPKRFADASGGITGHFSMDPVNRSRCPGIYNWDKLFAYLADNQPPPEEPIMIDLTNGTVASHFSADGTAWKCTNGFSIHGEILATYQKYGNSALCGLSCLGLPRSNEIPVGGHPGVVYQRFERGILCFDPVPHTVDTPPGLEQARVYPLHIDSGIGQDPTIAHLQAQIAALQALPAATRLLQINTLAAQIVKLSAVQ